MTSKMSLKNPYINIGVRERYCKIHKKQRLKYVFTKQGVDVDNIFKCKLCMIDDQIGTEYYLSIDDIIDRENQIFTNWPLQNERQLLEEIKTICNQQIAKQRLDLSQFFQRLVSEFIEIVENLERENAKKIKYCADHAKVILGEYNKRSKLEVLQQTLDEKGPDPQEQSEKTVSIISKINAEQEDHKKLFESLVQKMPIFDFEGPNKLKEQIAQLMRSLDLFKKKPPIQTEIQPKEKDEGKQDKYYLEKQQNIKQDHQQKTHSRHQSSTQSSTAVETWNFIIPKYCESSSLNIYEHLYGGVCARQEWSVVGSALSENILINEMAYSVIVQFSKPLKQCNDIRIGLIDDSVIDKEGIGTNNLAISFSSFKGRGANKVMRGNHLNSDELSKLINELEFRFCISSQVFGFADLLHDNIVICGEKSHIRTDGKYRFGVTFFTPGNDYVITFKEIRTSVDQSFATLL